LLFSTTLRVGGIVLKMRFAIPWAGGAATNQVFRRFSDGRIGVLQRSKELIIGGYMSILSPLQVAEEQARYYYLTNLQCKFIFLGMGLKITPEVRDFYKQLTSMGGKARAKKYDHATLSGWAKRGGRPRKDSQPQDEQSAGASPRSKVPSK